MQMNPIPFKKAAILILCLLTGCMSAEPFIDKSVQGLSKDQIAILTATKNNKPNLELWRITRVFDYGRQKEMLKEEGRGASYAEAHIPSGNYQVMMFCKHPSYYGTYYYAYPQINLAVKAGETYQLSCEAKEMKSFIQVDANSHVEPKQGEPDIFFSNLVVEEARGEFQYKGWNSVLHRYSTERVYVSQFDNPDIETAVINKMKSYIRDGKQDAFILESRRFGKFVTLNAKPEKDAELTDFLMMEFFPSVKTRK
jgi:hypothetical protein